MNCNFIASAYRYMEYARFGRLLERCRFAQLSQLAEVKKALILGEGDGRFVAGFALKHPAVTADVFETSRKMIQLAKHRLLVACGSAGLARIHWHHDSATRILPPANAYDLAVTHFFFDVFSTAELAPLVNHISTCLASRSLWLVSEFDLPTGGRARVWARFWIRAMYLFFRFATGLRNQRLPEWRDLLQKAGFRPRERLSYKNGFVVSELWERTGQPISD